MARTPNYKSKVKAVRRVLGGDPLKDVASGLGVSAEELESWKESFVAGGTDRIRSDFPPKSAQPSFPRPDPGMRSVAEALKYAAPKMSDTTYGNYLSNALAVVMANELRERGFEDVLPDRTGGFESRVQGAKGLKKLDVNYSTPEMGLSLGLSIKTISKRDPSTGRYTKNYSRNDNELRAEAVDYHRRQPWAVLAGFLFLPVDAADDSAGGEGDEAGVSSFGAAVRYFRYRTPRLRHDDEADLFEAFFVCLYEADGNTCYWPVHHQDLRPPKSRRPNPGEAMPLGAAITDCIAIYEKRNNPPFGWAAE